MPKKKFLGFIASITNAGAVELENNSVVDASNKDLYYTGGGNGVPATRDHRPFITGGHTIDVDADYSTDRIFIGHSWESDTLNFNGYTLNSNNEFKFLFAATDGVKEVFNIGDGVLETNKISSEAENFDYQGQLLINNGTIDVEEIEGNWKKKTYLFVKGSATINASDKLHRLKIPEAGDATFNVNSTEEIISTDVGTANWYVSNEIKNKLEVYNLHINSDIQQSNSSSNTPVTIHNKLWLNAKFTTTASDIEIKENAEIVTDSAQFNENNLINFAGSGKLLIKGDEITDFIKTWPVGTNNIFLPINITSISSIDSNPELGFSITPSKTVLAVNQNTLSRTWRISAKNISGTVSATFPYLVDDVNDDESNYEVYHSDLSSPLTWTQLASTSIDEVNHKIVFTDVNVQDGLITAGETGGLTSPDGVVTVKNGKWNEASVWSSGTVPTSSTNVIILHNSISVDNAPGEANRVIIAPGARLDLKDNDFTFNDSLIVSGLLENSDKDAGNYIFNGIVYVNTGGTFDLTGWGGTTAEMFDFRAGLENYGVMKIKTCSFTTNPQEIKGDADIYFTEPFVIDVNLTNNNTGGEYGFFYEEENDPWTGTGQLINSELLTYKSKADFGTAVDFTTHPNTLVYYNHNDDQMEAMDYYNLIITQNNDWGRRKEFKKGDVHILGDLTIKGNISRNSSTTLFLYNQESNVSHTLEIDGNLILDNSLSKLEFDNENDQIYHSIIVHGKVINNGEIDIRNNDSKYADLEITSTGTVMEGTGSYILRNLTLTGNGDKNIDLNDNLVLKGADNADTYGIYNTGSGNCIINGGNLNIEGNRNKGNTAILSNVNEVYNLNLCSDDGGTNHALLQLNCDLTINNNLTINVYDSDEGIILNENTLTLNGDYIQTDDLDGTIHGDKNAGLIINSSGEYTSEINVKDTLSTLKINANDPANMIFFASDLVIIDTLTRADGFIKMGENSLTIAEEAVLKYSDESSINMVAGEEWKDNVRHNIHIENKVALMTDKTIEKGKISFDDGLIFLTNGNLMLSDSAYIDLDIHNNYGSINQEAGFLKHEIDTTSHRQFPLVVGEGSDQFPFYADLEITNKTGKGNIFIELIPEKHPDNESTTDYIDGYWTLQKDAEITAIEYNAQVVIDNNNVQGDISNIFAAIRDGDDWLILAPFESYGMGAKAEFTCSRFGTITGIHPDPTIDSDKSNFDFEKVVVGETMVDTVIINTAELISEVEISVAAPFMVSLEKNSGFANNITIPNGFGTLTDTIFVSFTPDAEQNYNQTMTISSEGATDVYVDLSGTGYVNYAPTDINLTSNAIDEGQDSGTKVGSLSATDSNTEDQHVFSLVDGEGSDDNDNFEIDNSDILTTAILDFETQETYSIRIRATDNGNPAKSYEESFTINLNDLNDEAPVINTQSIVPVISSTAETGTRVLTVTASDADAVDDGTTFTFAITGGNTGDAFEIDPSSGEIAVAGTLSQTAYNIEVTVEDGASTPNTDTETFNVNVNFAPTDITLSDNTVDEGQSIATVVGDLSATDSNSSDSFTYELATGEGDDDNASFTIEDDMLKTAEIFDFETKKSYSVRVKVFDSEEESFEKQFSISINDLNDETPVIDTPPEDINVDDIAEAGTEVYTLTVTDADAQDDGSTFDFSILSGNTDNAFSIDNTGTISVDSDITMDDYSLEIEVEDAGGNTTSVTIDITVNPVSVMDIKFKDISLYPIPARNKLFIDLGKVQNAKIAIFSTNGKLITNKKINSDKVEINLDSYAKGTYILKLTIEQQILTRKFIIQ